ncbi:ATP synthase subunit I [Salinicola socius]|uniref:ATP synthase subunit I n=1 Tax=Salinicola socius TaxID=404433 RepID=A0A1Q8SSX0_9GAMM|nr:ATP synthase subunit I [Salinicola socius]OLO04472.1 ATP synthase subunit I [Salinicola socius]
MPDNISWILGGAAALIAGFTLGTIFFGGLWWTVQRGAVSKRPARWFFGSLFLRTGIVLAGFYLIGTGQPLRLGLCLLSFLLARAFILRVTRGLPATIVPGMAHTTGRPPCA